MAEEIDEVRFYREDFSTESEWEVFTAQLRELFQKWELSNVFWGRQLAKDELFHCKWKVQEETITLMGKDVALNYYIADVEQLEDLNELNSPLHNDLMATENTFGVPGDKSELHFLARAYGLRRFVIIRPGQIQTYFLSSPAEFTFFTSAATVVSAELCITVPIFLQIYNPKWNFFMGVATAPSLRTNFDVIALENAPPSYYFLSGLLTLFKEKLSVKYLRPATVSVCNTYALDVVQLVIPMRIPFGKCTNTEEEGRANSVTLCTTQFYALPDGYFSDSFCESYIKFTWPEMAENIVIDSALRSDFVPLKALYGCLIQNAHASSYLGSCLRDYMALSGNKETLESFVGRNFSDGSNSGEILNALDNVTETRFHKILHQNKGYNVDSQLRRRKLPGPMNQNELSQMIFYLFPDMHPDMALFKYDHRSKEYPEQTDFHRIKSATCDSLVHRLSCLLATCNAHFGGKSGMAQLWATILRELRDFWSCSFTIPGVAPNYPDMRTCLLHQKLQMLNVCIDRCNQRTLTANSNAQKHMSNEVNDEDNDDDKEDEFYECEDEAIPLNTNSMNLSNPEGRDKRFGDLNLLRTDEPLYIPITQDPVPKTEDQLYYDAEVMLRLGPGSDVTAQIMRSSLLSDMEAFKAANPKAEIEDFIRWYSPKDWEECTNDDGKSIGTLSPRMITPDNTWQTVWKQAQPVPVWRQKRLFDDTNEALKVLHYLETRTIGEIYELTVVPLFHSAIMKLKETFNEAGVFDVFTQQINDIFADLCCLSQEVTAINPETDYYNINCLLPNMDPIVMKIEILEKQFFQLKCLEHTLKVISKGSVLLADVKKLFTDMIKNRGVCNVLERRNDMLERRINSSGSLQDVFLKEIGNKLVSKDYVIRLDGETTSTAKGKTGPQFLRAIVTGEKLRLCSAFSENTTFV